jgi:hypothetical protein
MADRYDAVAVRRYKDRDGNEKSQFTTIGTAWPMKDKDGFTVRLNAVPAPTEGEFVILLMPPRPKDDNRASGQRRGNDAPGQNANFSRDLDDDIPFEMSWR